MSTAPDWLRESAVPVQRTLRQRVRTASAGALLTWGAVGVVAVCVLYAAASFVVHVHARSVQRAALEQAAVDALPDGVRLTTRGVYAEGDATGYASALSPLPPGQVLPALRPRGGSDWQPLDSATTGEQRAWVSRSGRYLLTIDVLPCSSDRAPADCPDGGSVLRVETAPGGPNS